MLSDPIADLLTRIRNAYAVKIKTVKAPYSQFKENLVKIMIDNNYLKSFKIIGKPPHRHLELILKYPGLKPAVETLTRISKPGVRVYAGTKDVSRLRKGRGITIISTPSGLMTLKDAKKKNIGGEIICKIS